MQIKPKPKNDLIMKKSALSLLILSLLFFVGCKTEQKPYSFYQVGPLIPASIEDSQSPDARAREEVASYMVKSGLVRTSMLGTPIIIEGAVEAQNDKQAIIIYDGMYEKLLRLKENMDEIAKKHGVSFSFQFQMTKGEYSTSLMPNCNKTVMLVGAPS